MVNLEDLITFLKTLQSPVINADLYVQTDHRELVAVMGIRLGNDVAGDPTVILDIRKRDH